MANRYDSRTTTFSPEGRLYQVEYAMEAVSYSGTILAIQCHEGIVMIAEKKITSKLLEHGVFQEKIYRISDDILCGVAGITSDANTLISYARKFALSYAYSYGQPIPVEQLANRLCDLKQSYTQFGGMRPFGVAFVYAGWDKHEGFQLYQSDPSGNYSRWKATCIGANCQAAQTALKQQYKEEMSLQEATEVAFKIFSKTMETTSLNGEKVELVTIEKSMGDGQVFCKLFSGKEVDCLLKRIKFDSSAK